MGPQDRNEGFICTQILQNIELDPTGTDRIGQIPKGKLGERLYQTFSISHGIPVLLCRQERWKLRPCQDYRYLNEHTVKNAYPLPLTPIVPTPRL